MELGISLTQMKRHTTILLTATCALLGTIVPVLAQTPPPEEKPPQWESSAFLGLTLTRGNSDTVLFTGNLKTQKKAKEDEWAFGVDGAYGENDGEKNNETLHGFGQYNRLFTERLFGYIRLDGLHDGIADVKYRVAISPGLGYYFIKDKMTSLAGEVGPGVVFENRGGDKQTYATLRVAERFEHKFSDNARCWQSAELLPQVDRFSNYILNIEAGVGAKITKSVELNIVAQDTYVNEPAAGRKANDFKLVSGVTYKF
jgi:putative salt-induced outer membrane protein YdiY